MAKYDRDYDYAEVPREARERLSRLQTDMVMVERARNLECAKRSYQRIIAKLLKPADRSRSRWVKLRAENNRRHELAREMGHWPMSRTANHEFYTPPPRNQEEHLPQRPNLSGMTQR